jgi:hypothetical protein
MVRISTCVLGHNRWICCGFDPSHLRHANVHDNNIGRSRRRQFHGLLTVLGLADDLKARLRLEVMRTPSRTIAWSSAIKILTGAAFGEVFAICVT